MSAGGADRSDHTIRLYLLGKLDPSDREALEHEYFTTSEALTRVEMAEDELIDRYLDKQLTPKDRPLFEQVFLTTEERREKMRLAIALRKRVARRAGLASWVSRTFRVPAVVLTRAGQGAIAALLLLAAGLGWLWNQEMQQTRTLQAERQTWVDQETELKTRLERADTKYARLDDLLKKAEAAKSELQAQIERLQGAAPTVRTIRQSLSVLLSGGALRSGGNVTRVSPSTGVLLVEFRLALPPEASAYQTFQAQLMRVDRNSQIVQNSLLRRRGGESDVIRFPVGSALLEPGDYAVQLGGFTRTGVLEELEQYSFRLVR